MQTCFVMIRVVVVETFHVSACVRGSSRQFS